MLVSTINLPRRFLRHVFWKVGQQGQTEKPKKGALEHRSTEVWAMIASMPIFQGILCRMPLEFLTTKPNKEAQAKGPRTEKSEQWWLQHLIFQCIFCRMSLEIWTTKPDKKAEGRSPWTQKPEQWCLRHSIFQGNFWSMSSELGTRRPNREAQARIPQTHEV